MKKELYYVGIDLHSNNLVLAIVNKDGRRITHQKLPCDLRTVLEYIEKFKPHIENIAVESTYNWYWLVDGLMENGFCVKLANPAGMQQYSGLKHSDDKTDAFFRAEL